MGSWPENTSSNFCLYWSSGFFSASCSSHQRLRGFCRWFRSQSLHQDLQFSYFSLHSGLKDFIWPHPGWHSDLYRRSSHGLICARQKKKRRATGGAKKLLPACSISQTLLLDLFDVSTRRHEGEWRAETQAACWHKPRPAADSLYILKRWPNSLHTPPLMTLLMSLSA